MSGISVGMCAYNEEANIRRSLESISAQAGADLREIIVISSGSTDRTDDIVREMARADPRIRLVRQERREGKNSAVNLFMSSAGGDILVLVNADNNLAPGTLVHLTRPFQDPGVGMVGGHPIPVNPQDTIAGFAVHMLWDMHHRLSLIYPKAGELVAFRNIHYALPTTMQSDEDILRMELERQGLRTVYAPEAIVYNKGPTTVGDFFRQRSRVNVGEMYMKRVYDYDIPTWNVRYLIGSYVNFLKDNRGHLLLMAMAMALEAMARLYASLYVALDKGDKAVWGQVGSTKDLGKGTNRT